MNFEQFAKKHWQGYLDSFIKEALDFYQMKSHMEQEEEPHLYLDSIAEENMLTRLVEATDQYADIEAAFDGRVTRNY